MIPLSINIALNCVNLYSFLVATKRLYKRVCPSVGRSVRRSVGPSVMLLSAGRDEPANDLFRVYELVTA